MELYEVKKREMPTTREWCVPVSKISHHMKKGSSERELGTRGLRIVAALGPASCGLSSSRLKGFV